MFTDRFDAGRQLAKMLRHYKNRDGIILAVPRGGVEIGYALAQELELPLEAVLSKKIGHPAHPEFAIGAVSLEGCILDERADVPAEYIEEETERLRRLLRERYKAYYGDRQPLSPTDRVVIIADDGIATGNTLLSTVELIRHQRPRRVVAAIPVAPPEGLRKIREAAGVDEVICLLSPRDFYAVGQYYENFEQVEDEQVKHLLEERWQADLRRKAG